MKYFTKHPVCPNCLEPLNEGIELIQFDENIFQCSKCGSKFKNKISFTNQNDLTIDFPLFTKVVLNKIESSYLDWILKGIDGKYLITWPWKEVKFIPILISEYLSKFENNKIVVFVNSKNLEKSQVSEFSDYNDLSYYSLLDSLYFTENEGTSEFSEKNGNELRINDVFLNNKLLYCKIHINTFNSKSIQKFKSFLKESKITPLFASLKELDGFVIPCGVVDKEKNVYEKFLIKFFSLYGKNFIKSINGLPNLEFEDKDLLNDIFFDDGLFELNFYESYKINPKISINDKFNEGFFNSLENKFDLIPFSYKFNYYFIKSDEDLNLFSQNGKIYFINEDILTDNLVSKIKEFRPDLMIATNIDSLFGEGRYKSGIGNQIYKLFELDSTFLMFSTVLKNRNKYQIGMKNWFFKKWGIIPHTWDYTPILNEIKKDESHCLSVFSSNFENYNRIKKSNLKFNFNVIEQLGAVESIFHIFNDNFKNNKEINNSLNELVKTPLYITGNKDFRINDHILNFEYLIASLYDKDEEKCKKVKEVFEKVYNYRLENPKNPMLDRLIYLIKNCNVPYEKLVIIVDGRDLRKLKKLLREKLGRELFEKILITNWSRLNGETMERKMLTYGIATRFPIIDYDIFSCELSEVDILCSPNNLEKYENYLNNRFTEKGFKPVYLLSKDENAPVLLKETLKLFGIPEDEPIEEYNEMLNQGAEKTYGSRSSIGKSNSYNENIQKNSQAILVFDEDDDAMFLPLKTIYYLDDGLIYPLEPHLEDDLSKLENKDILLNERKTCLSINNLFLPFVIDNGNDIVIRRRNKKYEWKGFFDLISSMYKWLDLFNQIIEIESLNKDRDEVKNNLAYQLSELNILRSNKEGIKRDWLKDPEILNTRFGEIKIYDAERPFYLQDSLVIFNWISKNYKELDVSRFYGKKSFNAAEELKRIRTNFFRNNKSEIDRNMYTLFDDFQRFIKGKIDTSDKFRVKEVQKVEIKKEVKAYSIVENHKEYI